MGAGNNQHSELGSAGTVLSFTTTDYDSAGRVVLTVDQYGSETQTTYDRFGRVSQTRTESANADGTPAWLVSRTVYDAFGRESVTTDPSVEGSAGPVYATWTVYDSLGRAERTERLQGVVVSLDPATGDTTLASAGTVLSATRTVFDGKGRTRLTVSATGEVTRYEYDDLGRQSAVISHAVLEGSTWVSQRTETEYDEHNRKKVERTNVRAVWSADPNSPDSTATFTIDRSQAREKNFEYGACGCPHVTKTTFEDGNFTTADYDDFGRKISEADELGNTTHFEYDAQDRLAAVVQPAVTNPATGLAEAPRTEYRYDAFGNQVSIEDANHHVTTFGYDAHNRQSSRTLPDVAGEPTAIESSSYNGYGDLDYTLDFKGQKADYVYDYELPGDTQLGLLRRVDYYPGGANTPAETVAYTYDPFGRKDTVTETTAAGSRVTDADYDGEGRVTRVLNADGEIHYGYNLLGQQVQMWTGSSPTFAGGTTGVEYGYDALGRLDLVREVRREGTTLAAPVETRYGFDFAGNLASVAVTQGSTSLRHTAYAYDPARGWLMGVTNRASAGGPVLSDFLYTRLANGQIETVTETVKQPDESFVNTTNRYTYDDIGRLETEVVTTSTQGGDYTTDYALDLVGNRVRKVTAKEGGAVERTEGTFDARDRLTQEQIWNAPIDGTLLDTITYGYDRNGSLTLRQTTSGSKTEQTWDLRNRLSGATVSQLQSGVWVVQTMANYQYTADGIRSRVTENGTATLYTIDGQSPSGYSQVVEERTPAGAVNSSYVYGGALDPITTHKGSITGVYAADGHSGVRQILSSATGTVLAAYRYDAWGNTTANAGTLPTPIGYRGERFDPILQQYYLRARLYDAAAGRFTAVDRHPGDLYLPGTLHKYAYASADPVNAMDPSGLFLAAGFGFSSTIGGGLETRNASAVLPVMKLAVVLIPVFILINEVLEAFARGPGRVPPVDPDPPREPEPPDPCYALWPELRGSGMHIRREQALAYPPLFPDGIPAVRTSAGLRRLESPRQLGSSTARNPNAPARAFVANWGNRGDQAGHIIANSFGGPGNDASGNIVPMAAGINLSGGLYRAMELRVEQLVRAGNTVCFEVMVDHTGSSNGLRPSSFSWTIMYRLNADPRGAWHTDPAMGPIPNR